MHRKCLDTLGLLYESIFKNDWNIQPGVFMLLIWLSYDVIWENKKRIYRMMLFRLPLDNFSALRDTLSACLAIDEYNGAVRSVQSP